MSFVPHGMATEQTTMSLLYDYASAVTLANGSPTDKVLESLARIFKYAQGTGETWLPDRLKSLESPNGLVDKVMLKDMISTAQAFWHTDERLGRLVSYCKKALGKPASALRAANQTLSLISGTSVTGADAYKELTDIIQLNLEFPLTESLHSHAKAVAHLWELPTVRIPKAVLIAPGSIDLKEKVISQDQWRRITRCIATYLKTKERGKLKKRMIASHNMAGRPFVMIAEELVMQMLAEEKQSVLQIGGEEKKRTMSGLFHPLAGAAHYMVMSGDNTKWNECLSPVAMGSLLMAVLDPKQEALRRLPSQARQTFEAMYSIIRVAYGFFADKTVLLGSGITCQKNKSSPSLSMSPWDIPLATRDVREQVELINDVTTPGQGRTWVEFPFGYGPQEAVRVRPGMLMGMFNAGSTLYALYAFQTSSLMTREIFKDAEPVHVDIRQSSDDFELIAWTSYSGPDWEQRMLRTVESIRRGLKHAGVNWSGPKSIMGVDVPQGELTSSYHDATHQGNVSIDVPGICPRGQNPYHDIASFVKFLHSSMLRGNMEASTASLALSVFLPMYERAHGLVKGSVRDMLNTATKERYNTNNVLYAQGGVHVYSPTTLALDEVSLRMAELPVMNVTIQRPSHLYFMHVLDPINPVSVSREMLDATVDGRRPQAEAADIPDCVFAYERRPNLTTKKRELHMELAARARDIVNLIESADAMYGTGISPQYQTVAETLYQNLQAKLRGFAQEAPDRANELQNRLQAAVVRQGLAPGHTVMSHMMRRLFRLADPEEEDRSSDSSDHDD